MHPTNCLNCATMLTADDRYCPSCGQKADTHRLSMSHIWHDLVHALTHADKGILFTTGLLATRPGVVAREYVIGKRKKYFNPFSYLAIIVGIYLIANSFFKPFSQPMDDFRPPSSAKTEAQKKKFQAINERRHKFGEFMNHRVNIVLFVSTPFIAFILWMLFRRKGFHYAEHLSTMAYVNGFLSLLTIFIFGPLLYVSRKYGGPSTLIYGSMMLSHVLYITIMYHGFLGYKSGTAYLKTFGAAIVAIIAWAILSTGVGMIYIMYGP